MKLTVNEIKEFFNSESSKIDRQVSAITADSREIKNNEVFFALKAENDGHKFAADAVKKGAAIVVVEKKIVGLNPDKQIIVKDTKEALLSLAAYYFKKFPKIKTIGITGSNGKTTTKELLSAIFKETFVVHKSEKSFNNYLGLPLTIFKLQDKHEVLVVELGMNHSGEIKKLVSAIKLDCAIITNVGRAHIGFFKNGKKGIAAAKAEIFEGVKKGGLAIINADDEYAAFLIKKAKVKNLKVITFGINNKAQIMAKNYDINESRTIFNVAAYDENFEMKLKGIHNLYNATAAITAAKFFNVSGGNIKKALFKFKMEGFMRFEVTKIKNAVTLINDCYNANPDSFTASIETLKKSNYKDLIVLMGDMMELGSNAKKYHEEIGRKFKVLNIRKFLVYGKYSSFVKKGYGSQAMIYTDKDKLSKDLLNIVKKDDVVFVKGSRGNKLEEIVKVIL